MGGTFPSMSRASSAETTALQRPPTIVRHRKPGSKRRWLTDIQGQITFRDKGDYFRGSFVPCSSAAVHSWRQLLGRFVWTLVMDSGHGNVKVKGPAKCDLFWNPSLQWRRHCFSPVGEDFSLSPPSSQGWHMVMDSLGPQPEPEIDYFSSFRAPRNRSGSQSRRGSRGGGWGGRPPLGRRGTIQDIPSNSIHAPVHNWAPSPGRNPVSAPAQKRSAPGGTNQGPAARTSDPKGESGPRRTDQGPQNTKGPDRSGPRVTDPSMWDGAGPCRSNHGRGTDQSPVG